MTYEPRRAKILALLRKRGSKPCQVIISACLGRDDHLEMLHRARTLAFTYDPTAKVNGWRS